MSEGGEASGTRAPKEGAAGREGPVLPVLQHGPGVTCTFNPVIGGDEDDDGEADA